MDNNNPILAQYEAAKIQGRSDRDPRLGIYLILRTYQAICFGKPAELADVNWKKSITDEYSTSTIITLQLETFKLEPKPLDTKNIVGKEIEVKLAVWYPQLPLFVVDYEILKPAGPTLADLNRLLVDKNCNVNFDESYDLHEDIPADDFDEFWN